MKQPEISVLITSYNAVRYIEQALASVLLHQEVDFEIVVVDDCSPDETWSILQKIRDSRVTILRTDSNRGPGATRNLGLTAAKGEWIAILDGDDTYLPGRLMRMLALAKVKQADIVVDNQQMTNETTGETSLMFAPAELAGIAQLTPERFIARNSEFSGGYGFGYFKPLLRAAFLKEHAIRYPESIRIGEDYLFLLECLSRGAKCVVDPQAGYGYTVRKGSISHRLTQADVASIQREDALFFANHPLGDAARKQQRIRSRNLIETFAYVRMVDAVKQKKPGAFLKAWYGCPRAIRQWKAPIMVRVNRLKKRG